MYAEPKNKFFVLVLTSLAVVFLVFIIQGKLGNHNTLDIDLTDRIDDSGLVLIPCKSYENVMLFGFEQHQNPDIEARQFLPLLEHLSETTGLEFVLHFTPKSRSLPDDLGNGTIQFAAVGACTYLQAETRYEVVPLVRSLNPEGKTGDQSMIIVAPDSPLQTVEDLRGKRFAYGKPNSTRGHLIPRITLAKHGISQSDLASFQFTDSHWDCSSAVINGHVEAGGVPAHLARQLAAENRVRILHSSINYPSRCIVANGDIPAHVLEKVKQALLSFPQKTNPTPEQTEIAYGFGETHDQDFEMLRDWSVRLGMFTALMESTPP